MMQCKQLSDDVAHRHGEDGRSRGNSREGSGRARNVDMGVGQGGGRVHTMLREEFTFKIYA